MPKASLDMARRVTAAKAFLEANASRAVRMSLLARSRPDRKEFKVGERVFYWRRPSSKCVDQDALERTCSGLRH